MHSIIPGILEKDWSIIEEKIAIVRQFSNSVHIDFIDGKFSPNITFLDPKPFSKYTKDLPAGEADLFLEAHLMVDNPLQYLEPLANAGFRRFLGHVEKMSNLEEFVARGEILGEVGLAIDGKTSLETINISYEDLDVILLMGIDAGFSGRQFQPQILDKIKTIREKTFIPIEVDGGVNDKTILEIKKAGADRFVVTSFLFKEGDPSKNYQTLLNLNSQGV